jgi:D-alanyl-D-alanine carboxypeptidase
VPSALKKLWRQLGISADYARRRGLRPQREATVLVSIGRNPDGRVLRLTPAAANAWRAMRGAAADDGIILVPISGFRSVRRQTKIIREKLAAGRAIDDVLRSVAAPGCSEHHTGRALDIGSPEELELDEHFARTPAFRWLQRHAAKFGFRLSFPKNNPHGIVYEPWHWCWHRAKP